MNTMHPFGKPGLRASIEREAADHERAKRADERDARQARAEAIFERLVAGAEAAAKGDYAFQSGWWKQTIRNLLPVLLACERLIDAGNDVLAVEWEPAVLEDDTDDEDRMTLLRLRDAIGAAEVQLTMCGVRELSKGTNQ